MIRHPFIKAGQWSMYFTCALLISCGTENSTQDRNIHHNHTNQALHLELPQVEPTPKQSRFLLMGDILYSLDGKDLMAFDLSKPTKPEKSISVSVSTDITSLAHDQSHLFVGSDEGSDIYLKGAKSLTLVGSLTHRKSCTVAVPEKLISFAVLRQGDNCIGESGFGRHGVSVISTRNPKVPVESEFLDLVNVGGIGAVENRLFVCNKSDGLGIYDKSNSGARSKFPFTHGGSCSDILVTGKDVTIYDSRSITQFKLMDDGVIKKIGEIRGPVQ